MNEQDLQNSSEEENTTSPVQNEEAETVVDAVEEVVKTDVGEVAEVTDTIEEVVTETAEVVEETTTEAVGDSVSDLEPIIATASAVPLVTKVKDFVSAKRYTIAAVVLVLVGILGLVYIMEEQGKLDTGIFDGAKSFTSKYQAAATVNGEKISLHDVNVSVNQLSAGAAAQGADVTSEEVKAELEKQALDMLINTELLKQEAVVKEVEVTDAEVEERLNKLKEDVGGEEVLAERMAQFNIDQKTLLRDIRNELTIQRLLEKVFAEKTLEVTEEEIKQFYDQAGGAKAGLPDLSEVRDQIETQIKAGKEQEIVTALIEELRAKATIETKI